MSTPRPALGASAFPCRSDAILAVAWLLACCAWISPSLLIPDGAGYWAWLPTALLDRDLLLYDEWILLGLARDGWFEHQWITPTLHLSNHWGPGAAIAWAPGWLLGDLASRLPPLDAFPRDGFRLPHVAGGAAVDAMLALGAALLARRVARRWTDERTATLAAFGLLFGSPLLHYGLRSGMTAHAAATFAAILCLHLALRLREEPSWWTAAAAGLACGWAFSIRPQLLALAIVPMLLAPALRLAAPLAAGLLLGALPQLIASAVIYGSLMGAMGGGPSAEGRPYAAFERIWTWEPWLSGWHGLVPWTPFLALGLGGLWLLARRDRRLAAAALLVVLSQAAAVAALDRPFWGAHAFGQRRLDGLAGPALIGAALLLGKLPRRAAIAVTAACCAWTTALFLASWTLLPLNEPTSWSDLARAAGSALSTPGEWARPLAALPAAGRGAAAVALLAVALPLGLLAWGAWRLPSRARIAVAASWLALCGAWLAICGLHDASRVDPWRAAAERHRALGPMAGSVFARIGMLRQEAEWLRRRGRPEDAAAVDARADDFVRRLQAARDAASR